MTKKEHLTREEGKKLLAKPNRRKSIVQRIRERKSKKQRVVSRAHATFRFTGDDGKRDEGQG